MTITEDLLIKCAFSLIIAFVAILDYRRQQNEKNDRIEQYAFNLLLVLPLYLLISFFVGLLAGGEWDFYTRIIPNILRICLVWVIYDGILIFSMPYLRRFFSASTCAYLWILPNFLYIIMNASFGSGSELFLSWLSIYIPKNILNIFLIVWFLGFLFIAGKMIWDHHCFEKALMDEAYLETDGRILEDFMQAKSCFDKQGQIKLYRSAAIKTPVSLGTNLGSMKIVLPERDYTKAELNWIYRHEITHLRKNDCALKFFLGMTNAIFWFVPFTWIASKRLTEDQELSCDQMVLAACDQEKRKEYANLLLNTAGDSRGFSTCLSSTGQSMRYRLSNVMHPKANAGIHNPLIILMCLVIMTVSVFSIDITTTAGKANELIFQTGTKKELDHIESIEVYYEKDPGYRYIIDFDEEEWLDYLNNVNLMKVSGSRLQDSDYEVMITYRNNDPSADCYEKECHIYLRDNVLDYWNYEYDSYSYILSDCSYKNLIEDANVLKKEEIPSDDEDWEE